jgi:hypothetical protein
VAIPHPDFIDHFGGILIAVVRRPATYTLHRPHFQIQLAPPVSAFGTDLTGRLPAIDYYKFSPVLDRLSFAKYPELPPALKANRSSKLAVLYHSRHVQIF